MTGSTKLDLYAGFFVIIGLTLAVLVWAAIELWRKPGLGSDRSLFSRE